MARIFSGTNQDINFGSASVLDNVFAGGGTVFAVIRPENDGEGNKGYIISKSLGASNGWLVRVEDDDTNDAEIAFFALGTSFGKWETGNIVPLNEYSYITVTYDSDSFPSATPSVWVNGSKKTVGSGLTESSTPSGSYGSDAAEDLIVGDSYASTRAFDGDIGHCAMWTVVLSDAEITALHNGVNPFNIRPDSLIFYAPIHGNESPEPDYMNQNNGTVTGATKSSQQPIVELLNI